MAKKDIKQDNVKKTKKEEKNKKRFFKDFKAELKKVVWPTPKQLLNNTIAVITIVLVVGVIVFVLDRGFEFLNKQNAQLQAKVQENYSNSVNNSTTSNVDEASSADNNTEINNAE